MREVGKYKMAPMALISWLNRWWPFLERVPKEVEQVSLMIVIKVTKKSGIVHLGQCDSGG